MRLDARIPVHVVPSGLPLPQADPQAVLLVAGPPGQACPLDGTRGWMAVQHLSAAVPDAAVLHPGRHPGGCACCAARDPLALVLSSLFERRARGALGLFRRVWLAAPPGLAEAVPALLDADPVVAGRYRIGEN